MEKTKRLPAGDLTWMDGVAVTAVAMVAAPYAIMLFATFPYFSIPLGLILVSAFFAGGWGLQSLVCRLLRYSRPREGSGYEVKHKYYHFGLALPCWGAAALIFLILPRAVDAFLYFVAAHSTTYLYDQFSVYPVTAGVVAAVLLLLGSAVRLYPYTRVVSMRSCMTYVALFLIAFLLDNGRVSAPCLFVFAICTALLLNQMTLERELTTLSLPDLPRETRMGGVSAVLWLGLIFLGVCAVLTVIVGGGMMVGRMLFFMLLRGMFDGEGGASSQYQYESSEEIMGMLRRYLVRGDESPWLNYLLMVLFVLGGIAVILWFALRHNAYIRRWLYDLWLRFSAFIDWLFGASTRIYYRPNHDGEEISYREVRKKLTPVEPVIGRDVERMGWREFRSQLASRPSDEEKLTYAYAVLAAVLRAQPVFPLLRSDTPRRIEQKVRARGRHEELREITAVYETVAYAERSPAPEETRRALDQVCMILREYFR